MMPPPYMFCMWPTKGHHCSGKPSLPPRLRSDGGMFINLLPPGRNDLTHMRCYSPASTRTE